MSPLRSLCLLAGLLVLALLGSSCARRQLSPPTYYQSAPSTYSGGMK